MIIEHDFSPQIVNHYIKCCGCRLQHTITLNVTRRIKCNCGMILDFAWDKSKYCDKINDNELQ